MNKTRVIVMTIFLAFLVSAQNATGLTKSRAALSPYFQTDVDSTYSFLGVTHPSLQNAASTIGLTVSTVGNTGDNPSSTFTIQAGETYRIFLVSTNHSTINNLTVTGNEVIFLSTTSGSSEGAHVTFTGSCTNCNVFSGRDDFGALLNPLQANGLQALNMLSIWGAVVIPGTTSGFAMEFIGDAHDSLAAIVSRHDTFQGRGVN